MPSGLPNLLTFSRILAIPVVICVMLFVDAPMGAWIALGIYSYACVTDFFDGYLARAFSQQSALGRFMDPIADKLLVASVLLTLVGVDRLTGVDILPAAVILCREILVSGLREFLADVKVGMPVSRLAKWKTSIQLFSLGFLIVGPTGPHLWLASTLDTGLYLLWAAAILTLITGLDYLLAGLRHIREQDSRAEGADAPTPASASPSGPRKPAMPRPPAAETGG